MFAVLVSTPKEIEPISKAPEHPNVAPKTTNLMHEREREQEMSSSRKLLFQDRVHA